MHELLRQYAAEKLDQAPAAREAAHEAQAQAPTEGQSVGDTPPTQAPGPPVSPHVQFPQPPGHASAANMWTIRNRPNTLPSTSPR